MARTDAIVLGAGVVGASIALHLAKRGLSVALVDKGGAGEGTSYGNAGIIEGCTVFPQAFPGLSTCCCGSRSSRRRKRTIICRFCRRSRRGCGRFASGRRRNGSIETAHVMRPFFARALAGA